MYIWNIKINDNFKAFSNIWKTLFKNNKKKKLKKKFISKEIEVIIIFNHKFNIKISNWFWNLIFRKHCIHDDDDSDDEMAHGDEVAHTLAVVVLHIHILVVRNTF